MFGDTSPRGTELERMGTEAELWNYSMATILLNFLLMQSLASYWVIIRLVLDNIFSSFLPPFSYGIDLLAET